MELSRSENLWPISVGTIAARNFSPTPPSARYARGGRVAATLDCFPPDAAENRSRTDRGPSVSAGCPCTRAWLTRPRRHRSRQGSPVVHDAAAAVAHLERSSDQNDRGLHARLERTPWANRMESSIRAPGFGWPNTSTPAILNAKISLPAVPSRKGSPFSSRLIVVVATPLWLARSRVVQRRSALAARQASGVISMRQDINAHSHVD